MATRIVVRGRTIWSDGDWRKQSRAKIPPVPRDREGRVITDEPPPGKVKPYREGTEFWCDADQLRYRVVTQVDPRQGWATSAFWQDRWIISHKEVIKLARGGLLDAAIPEGSTVRRYRCRDESAVLASKLMKSIKGWRRNRPPVLPSK